MDLISREVVITIATSSCLDLDSYDDTDEFCNEIKELPSAFEGMTYGEVIKAIFGIKDEQVVEAKYLVSIYPIGNSYDPFIAVKKNVWNSPYQKGGE